jgi:putative transposase
MTGLSFWATGYCVSTVGLDEEKIKRYIKDKDKLDRNQVKWKYKLKQPL